MQSKKRARARRIDRQTRPLEIVEIGETVGEQRVRAARAHIGLRRVRGGGQYFAIVAMAYANEDSNLPSRELGWPMASVLHRLPTQLEQEALLRIHQFRFPGGNPEERRIEFVDALQEPGLVDSLVLSLQVDEGRPPPPSLRHRDDAMPSALQNLPEALRRDGATREPAGHADDGNGIAFLFRARSTTPLGGQHLLELLIRHHLRQGRGQFLGRLVLEQEHRSQLHAETALHERLQLDQLEGIQPHVHQRPLCRVCGGTLLSEQGEDLLLDEGPDDFRLRDLSVRRQFLRIIHSQSFAEHDALTAGGVETLSRQRVRSGDGKARALERADPLRQPEEAAVSQALLGVLEQPVSMQQGAAEEEAILEGRVFVHDEETAGFEESAHLHQCEIDVPRIVQDVRGDDDVEAVRLESLS